MTDHAKALVVYLSEDLRIGEDEAANRLMDAISCMRGVIRVEPLVTTLEDHMARERVRWELRGKLLEALNDD